jgi:tRNA C32,U32 (ribose-2'-O)-methylase TrmJ
MAAGLSLSRPENRYRFATADEMEGFYRHLEETLIAIGFLDADNPRQLMRRLRRLFGRARPNENELNILRGVLTAMHKARR